MNVIAVIKYKAKNTFGIFSEVDLIIVAIKTDLGMMNLERTFKTYGVIISFKFKMKAFDIGIRRQNGLFSVAD